MSNSDGSGGRQLRLVLAVNDFEHFLSAIKGLSVSTRECNVRHVLALLTEVGGDTAGVVDLGGVSAQRVRSYVTDQVDVVVAVGRNQERHAILDTLGVQPARDHTLGQAFQREPGVPGVGNCRRVKCTRQPKIGIDSKSTATPTPEPD